MFQRKRIASDATPAYISSAYADKYLLDIGDEITLKESYEDDTYTFSIEGIYDYEGGLTVFLPQDTASIDCLILVPIISVVISLIVK